MLWLLFGIFSAVAIFAVALGLTCFNLGFDRARRIGYSQGRFDALADVYAHIDASGEPLTLGFFEQHCHTTVTSDLYGTPDWFTHVAFKYFGEAGEFAEHVGKASRDDGWSIFKGTSTLTPARRELLLKELGDALWYIVMLARELGSNLAEIMLLNIKKREGRKQRGTLKGAGDDR